MAKSNSGPIENDGDFARAVKALFEHAHPGASAFDGNANEDVRRVAFGLAAMRDLVEDRLRAMTISADLPSSGLGEALGILDHLTTGKDHQIARHIRGLKVFRQNRMQPNMIEQFRRDCAVGIARAVEVMMQLPQSTALSRTAGALKEAGWEVSSEQLRNWYREAARKERRGPDAFANILLRQAAPDLDRLLALGKTWVIKLRAVADIPKA